jgi:RHS repeat-associated protein
MQLAGECPTCGTAPNSQAFYDDPSHPLLKTREVDGKGTVTLYTYDANGQVTSRTEAFGTPLQRPTTWEHNGPVPGLVTATEMPSTSGSGSRRTLFTYDAEGNLLTETIAGVEAGNAFNLTTTRHYSAAGRLEETDPPGYGTQDVTRFTYDQGRGNMIPMTRTDPLIGASSFSYDPFNRRTAETDPNGVRTLTSYDDLDRVTAVTQEGGTPAESLTTRHEHNVFGDLVRTILPRGNIIEYGYDAAGRLISIEKKPDRTTPGERTFYTLDSYGHHIREDQQRWNGTAWVTDSTTAYEYSSRCHLDKVLHADGSFTEYAYDCDGNLERVWDANHPSNNRANPATTTYEYDRLQRISALIQPWTGAGGGTAVTRYEYDIQDHLVKVTDAEGNVTRYAYSDRDLMTQQISEVSGTTEYRYNEHGELTAQTDARGIIMNRTIDALRRVTFIDYSEDTLDTRYTFDDPLVPFSKGRLTAIIRNGGTVPYRYDRFGRILQDGALTYGYDENGNRQEIGYPGGVTASYVFDFSDREERLVLTEPGQTAKTLAANAGYLANGPLTSLLLGNGLVESRTFDGRYFPSSIRVPGKLDWEYETDRVGNILSIQDALNPSQPRNYAYQNYSYFLTQGDGPWGNLAWTYDKIGNRLTQTDDGVTEIYSYLRNAAGGNNPKLVRVAPPLPAEPTSYFYDRMGNQTHRSMGEGKLRLTYNAEGQLSQMAADIAGQSPAITQIRYDGRSFLDLSIFSSQASAESQAQTHATYSSEGLLLHKVTMHRSAAAAPRDQPIEERDSYIFYFAGRPVALFEKSAVIPRTDTRVETWRLLFLTADQPGTPVLLTDESGNVRWAGGFNPFGKDLTGESEAGIFLRFPGQWEDSIWSATTGVRLFHNVHRWYDPGTGRYTQADPMGVGVGLSTNLYSYVDGRPTFAVDRLGLVSSTADCPKNACCTAAAMQKEFQQAWKYSLMHQKDYDLSAGSLCSGQSCETSAFELRKDLEKFVTLKCWVTSTQLTKGGLPGKLINPITKWLFGIHGWVHYVVKFTPCNADKPALYIDLYTHPNYGKLDPSEELDHP